MRKASVMMHAIPAGILEERERGKDCVFRYVQEYAGPPVSLAMPLSTREYSFPAFPSFLEGLLPEGVQLEGLLRQLKIDRDDFFAQLMAVGHDLVGAVTVEEIAS